MERLTPSGQFHTYLSAASFSWALASSLRAVHHEGKQLSSNQLHAGTLNNLRK